MMPGRITDHVALSERLARIYQKLGDNHGALFYYE